MKNKKSKQRPGNLYSCKRCAKNDFKSAMKFTAHLNWCDGSKPTMAKLVETPSHPGKHPGDMRQLALYIKVKADELHLAVSQLMKGIR